MARNSILRQALLASCLTTVGFIPSYALAQATPSPDSPAQVAADVPQTKPGPEAPVPSDRGTQLQDIVVTAQRRETSLQKTPISIVALSSAKIAQTAVRDVQDLGVFVPNLSIGSGALGPSLPTFSIRGVGQSSTRIHQEAGVALYVDDLYYPRTVGALFQIVDLERVEVLRGPQGTLFGRNATGGAVRFVTKKPVDYFEARASSTVGSYGRLDVDGMLNVPLTDGIAVRVQAARLTDTGYITEYKWNRASNTIQKDQEANSGSRDDTLVRGAIRLMPSAISRLTVDLSATYQSQRGTPPGQSVRSIAPSTGTAALTQRSFYPFQVYLTRILGRPASGVNDPLVVAPSFYSDVDRCVNDDPTIPITSLPTYPRSQTCSTRLDMRTKIVQGTVAYSLTRSDHA